MPIKRPRDVDPDAQPATPAPATKTPARKARKSKGENTPIVEDTPAVAPKPTKTKIDTPYPKAAQMAAKLAEQGEAEAQEEEVQADAIPSPRTRTRSKKKSAPRTESEEQNVVVQDDATPAPPALLGGGATTTGSRSRRRSKASATPAGGTAPIPMNVDDSDDEVDKYVREVEEQTASPLSKKKQKQLDKDNKKAAASLITNEISVFTTSDINPYVSGITSMTLNKAEDAVAIAREDGSVLLFDILTESNIGAAAGATKDEEVDVEEVAPTAGGDDKKGGKKPMHLAKGMQKTPERFVFRAATGGKEGSSIVRLCWAGGQQEYLIAAFFSGQIVQYNSHTLEPVSLHPRSGGAVWDFTWASELGIGFAAVADGQVHCYQLRTSDAHLEFVRTFPKISGSNRALTVAYSEDMKLLCSGDDGRTIVGWDVKSHEDTMVKRQSSQRFVTRLPDGLPLSSVLVPEEQSVCIGTSLNEVFFLDALMGSILKVFSHHKGPVVCLANLGGMVFATGWHELLRAYRVVEKKNEWYPAETKRRTHYHEASALVTGSKTKLLLSAARDGTVMHSGLAKLFSHHSLYFDATNDRQFDAKKNLLVKGAGKDVEVFKFNITAGRVAPWMRFRIGGKFNIKGVWLSESATLLAVATDDRLRILNIDHVAGKLSLHLDLAVGAVSHVAFHPAWEVVFVSVGTKVHWLQGFGLRGIQNEGTVDLGAATGAITSLKVLPGSPQSVLAMGTRKDGLFTLRLKEETGLPFGGPSKEATMLGVTEIDAAGVARTSQGFFTVHPSTNTTPSLTFPVQKSDLAFTSKLPLNSHFLQTTAECSKKKNGALLSFSRGLVYSDDKKYTNLLSAPIAFAGTLTVDQDEEDEVVVQKQVPIVLKRNVEAIVRELPEMWRVRRFAN